jgi:hypothetical protein
MSNEKKCCEEQSREIREHRDREGLLFGIK